MNSAAFDYRNPPQLFDVGTVLAKLWARRLLILAITLAVIFAAAFYVVTTRPSFTATAAILVDPRDIKTTNIDNVLPGIGADSAAIASQVSVIESRDLLGKVFADLHLDADPEYASSGFAAQLFSAIRPSVPPSPEVVLQKFLGTVSVEREGLTYVIDISVKSSDPLKAARIANAIVEHYLGSNAAQQTTATTGVTTALNGKITALQSGLAAAERAVADFRRQNGIFDETTGGTLQSQADQLTTQIMVAKDTLNQAQTKYDQAVAVGSSPADFARLSDVSSSLALDKLRDDYNARVAALASAEATLGSKHPTIVAAKAELARASALLSEEASRITRQLKSDRDLAATNLGKLQANLDTVRQQSNQSNLAQIELRQLQRKAGAALAVLSDFMQRSQETSQIDGLQTSQVHVISQAAPPPDPTWPKPMLLLPVSAVLGLMLGAGLALLLGERQVRIAPEPVPAGPDRPRREATKLQAVRTTSSAARRLAGLDRARHDLLAGRSTPVALAVQRLLDQLFDLLPQQGGPFILAFSAGADTALAEAGATLTSAGFEHIGGRALLLDADDGSARAGDYDFVLVTSWHPLAARADFEILVLDPETAWLRSPDQGLALVLDLTDEVAVRPAMAADSAPSLAVG